MRKNTFNLFFSLFVLFFTFVPNNAFNHRSKRFLTFPRRNWSVVQLITGVGLPVNLELEAVTIGFVFKYDFWLPQNASDFLQLLSDPFEPQTHTLNKRSVSNSEETYGFDDEQQEKFEKHLSDADVVESGTVMDDITNDGGINNNLATTRWLVYKALAEISENYGLAGRSCVLRTICESAHTPFDYSNGVLGELFHVIMTPSLTNDEIVYHEDNEYLHAENLGKDGAPCENVFDECKVSLLDQFSGIFSLKSNPIDNLFH